MANAEYIASVGPPAPTVRLKLTTFEAQYLLYLIGKVSGTVKNDLTGEEDVGYKIFKALDRLLDADNLPGSLVHEYDSTGFTVATK